MGTTKMSTKHIVIAGNQWFTKYLVDQLMEAEYSPTLFINMPPEKSEKISGYHDFGPLAKKLAIPIYRPTDFGLRVDVDKHALQSYPMDVLLVFGWQRLIPPWLIAHCDHGVYGVHGGPEKPPRCRGQAVFNWALILNAKRFFMYLFRISTGADEGDIVDITEFDITPFDNIQTLYHKNCIVSTRMILNNLPAILQGTVSAIPQTGEPTVLPGRRPENGGIDWTLPAERIHNMIRALAPPYPGAFTELKDKRVTLHEGYVFDRKISFPGKPGEILDIFPSGHFIIMTGDYPLYVKNISGDGSSNLQKGMMFKTRCGESLPDPVY